MNAGKNFIHTDDKINLVMSMQKVIEKIFKLDSEDDEDLQYCFKVLVFDDYVYDIF